MFNWDSLPCEWSSTCYLQFEKNGMLEVTYTARTCQWNDSIAHSTVAFIIMVLKAGQKPEIEMLEAEQCPIPCQIHMIQHCPSVDTQSFLVSHQPQIVVPLSY